MNTVGDRSIKKFESILSGDVKAKLLIDLHDYLAVFDLKQAKIIKKFLIESIYNFLDMLEQNEESMRLLISQDGNNENNSVEISDSLSGKLFTADG